MPRQVLFVQGGGETVHDAWDNKLVHSLKRELGDGYAIHYPRMPNEGDPRYSAWKAALLGEFDHLEDGSILIGHSVGGAILIHVLAERLSKCRPAAISLIAAPFIGEDGWPSDDVPRLDFDQRLPRAVPVFLYHGTADEVVPLDHIQLYARSIPRAVVRALKHRDHQLNNDLSEVAHDIHSLLAQRRG